MKVKAGKHAMEKWIRAWEHAGSSLREMKIKTLRDPNYYSANRDLLDEMLYYAFEKSSVRFTSGLVEMQRVFMKHRT